MDNKFYKEEKSKINLDFTNSKIKGFSPSISNNLAKDKKKFSTFWRNCYSFLQQQTNKTKLDKSHKTNIQNLNHLSTLSKKIFLTSYASQIYNKLTSNRKKYIRIEDLVYKVNKFIPNLTPSKDQILLETRRKLEEKIGIELDQGVFLSSILSNSTDGKHLCEAMLKPSKIAIENLEKFNRDGYVNLKKAIVKKHNYYTEVILNNPNYLNAEDEHTLYPLEAAIDLALLCDDKKICVLRGSQVSHSKYKSKRIFGSGINLTHLYAGKISFMWYLIREMGAVHKVYRGIHKTNKSVNSIFYPFREKLWIGALETFAIGGGCQYLLVLDHIIADKDSYMTLPARKEGIIPGAANLRLWRFVGDRAARQAIQNGLRINASDKNGLKICDNIVNSRFIDKTLSETVKSYHNSGVVGASFNRRALRSAQETIDNFREYIAYYAHDQAYCHLSKELVKNLEKFWKKK